MTVSGTSLFVMLAIPVGCIFLQIFLAKRVSRWPGLILPAATLGCSLLAVLGVAVYDGMSGGEILLAVGIIFVITNVPTLVFLAIYFACRKVHTQLDKMHIQDLD